jgi:hypothetical protein
MKAETTGIQAYRANENGAVGRGEDTAPPTAR